jgi:hypothetical protein
MFKSPTSRHRSNNASPSPATDRAQLDAIMRAAYTNASERTGFKLRRRANAYYLYFFFSEHTAKTSTTAFVGSVMLSAHDHGRGEPPRFNNDLGDAGLLQQACAASGFDWPSCNSEDLFTEGATDGALIVHWPLKSFQDGEYRTTNQLDPNTLWREFFLRARMLFEKTGEIQSLQLQATVGGETVADVTITRTQWEAMNYGRTIEAYYENESALMDEALPLNRDDAWLESRTDMLYLAFYREMLGTLPDDVKIIDPDAGP